MATFFKRVLAENLVIWQAKIRRKGYPSQSKVFSSRRDAEAWAFTVESEMARGMFISRSQSERTTFGAALERYGREVTPTKRSADDERYKIERLRASKLAHYSLVNLTGTIIAAWRDARLKTAKPATVTRELALISHVFTIARKEWGMDGLTNPVMDIRKPSLVGTARTRRLEPGEEQDLLRRARAYGEPMPTIIILALETAMRRGEIAGLLWKNIDLRSRVIHLAMTKNGCARDVPLSGRSIEVLGALPRRLDGRVFAMRGDSITHAFGKLCAADNHTLLNLRFHDLRHEATSRFFERGLNPMEVAAITGHKTLGMLKRYTHLKAEDLAMKLG